MTALQSAPMSAVAATQLAETEQDVRSCEELYQSGRRVSAFWLLSDLRSSAGYRLLAGDAPAYVRTEVFTRTLRRLYSYYSGVDVLKEMGDALLIRSDGLRPILEVVCVYDALVRLWAAQREHRLDISLEARTAVTFGPATRLERTGFADYVGQPLDRVARVSSLDQPEGTVCVIEDGAIDQDHGVIDEYPFLSADGPHLSTKATKPGEKPVRYWNIGLDRGKFAQFREYFRPLRGV